jgi:hypothetical protein
VEEPQGKTEVQIGDFPTVRVTTSNKPESYLVLFGLVWSYLVLNAFESLI